MNGKQLRKYLNPGLKMILVGAVALVVGIWGTQYSLRPGAPYAILLLAALFLVFGVKGVVDFQVNMAKLAKSESYESILRDFEGSRSFAGDALQVGGRSVFRKGSGEILDVRRIRRTYCHISISNGKERRIIWADKTDGKKTELCRLEISEEGDREARELLELLKACNPEILTEKA